MELIHTIDNDPPTRSARERDQQRLDQAVADFLAKGNQIESVSTSPQLRTSPASDAALVKSLIAHASNAKTLLEAAKILNEPEERCRRLAVLHRIPFRSKAFLRKRDSK